MRAWQAREQRLSGELKTVTDELKTVADELKTMTESRDEQQRAATDLREAMDVVEASPFWKLRNLILRK